jgi:hypothetical protein
MNSKEKLANALREWYFDNDLPQETCLKVDQMILKAEKCYYSDYDSQLTMPCVQLVNDLTEIGAHSLVELAKNGEFDATEEESEAWYEREGKAVIEASGLPKELFERKK